MEWHNRDTHITNLTKQMFNTVKLTDTIWCVINENKAPKMVKRSDCYWKTGGDMMTTFGAFENTFWRDDTIWRRWSSSTMVEIRASYLTITNDYLNQNWFIVNYPGTYFSAMLYKIQAHWLKKRIWKCCQQNCSQPSRPPCVNKRIFSEMLFRILTSNYVLDVFLKLSQHWLNGWFGDDRK